MGTPSVKVHDGKVLRRLVRGATKSVKVRRVLADGMILGRILISCLKMV